MRLVLHSPAQAVPTKLPALPHAAERRRALAARLKPRTNTPSRHAAAADGWRRCQAAGAAAPRAPPGAAPAARPAGRLCGEGGLELTITALRLAAWRR